MAIFTGGDVSHGDGLSTVWGDGVFNNSVNKIDDIHPQYYGFQLFDLKSYYIEDLGSGNYKYIDGFRGGGGTNTWTQVNIGQYSPRFGCNVSYIVLDEDDSLDITFDLVTRTTSDTQNWANLYVYKDANGSETSLLYTSSKKVSSVASTWENFSISETNATLGISSGDHISIVVGIEVSGTPNFSITKNLRVTRNLT